MIRYFINIISRNYSDLGSICQFKNTPIYIGDKYIVESNVFQNMNWCLRRVSPYMVEHRKSSISNHTSRRSSMYFINKLVQKHDVFSSCFLSRRSACINDSDYSPLHPNEFFSGL